MFSQCNPKKGGASVFGCKKKNSILNRLALYFPTPSLPYTNKRKLEAHWPVHLWKPKSMVTPNMEISKVGYRIRDAFMVEMVHLPLYFRMYCLSVLGRNSHKPF